MSLCCSVHVFVARSGLLMMDQLLVRPGLCVISNVCYLFCYLLNVISVIFVSGPLTGSYYFLSKIVISPIYTILS